MAMWNPWRGCKKCIPDDWNNGYDNVVVCCTVENQKMQIINYQYLKNFQ